MSDLSREGSPHLVDSETNRLDFMGHDAHRVLGEGWDDIQGQVGQEYNSRSQGIWSMCLESTLFVDIMTPRDLSMHLVMKPRYDANLPAQEVRVLWNDVMVGMCRFNKMTGANSADFDIAVPARAMAQGKNRIAFVSNYAASEMELGRGRGRRREAFLLLSLSLTDSNQKTPPYSHNTHGAYPKPTPVRFEHGAIAQWGTSCLKFPLQIGPCRRAVLRFTNPEAQWNRRKQVALVCDELTGPHRVDVYPYGSLSSLHNSVEIDLTPYAGKTVEVLFETREIPESMPVHWGQPEVLFDPVETEPREAQAAPPDTVVATQPTVSNVVLIVLDACRFDRFQLAGAKRQPATFIDEVSGQSIVFERAYAAAPYTYASTSSLLTGLHFCQTGASFNYMNGTSPIARFMKLPDVLAASGIRTACVSANLNISRPSGLAEGFADFVDASEAPDVLQNGGSPESVTNAVQAFLQQHGKERFFLYAHYRQPHEPYNAPTGYVNTLSYDLVKAFTGTTVDLAEVNDGAKAITRDQLLHLQTRYDENVRAGDAEVRKIFGLLKAGGLDGNTAVIIMADHGEAFKEHGYLSHNLTLYEEMVHIPLILKLPGSSEGIVIRDTVAQTVDIFPTVCALLGIKAPARLEGRNLLSAPRPTKYGVRATSMNDPSYGWEAFWFDRYKLIINRMKASVEVYDLDRDKGERVNLADVQPVLADFLLANALSWKRELPQQAAVPQTATPPGQPVNQETLEKLKALGYL